ncbi:hypothetical protein THAOC_18282 [Thalassiosira oceanica]|uniref:Uncharacterized protein n=1 Tax=Thalassiosira oceanica TaxID=159749 RepID=K0SJU9_THAOC|nr:hypothetical protein THAOC_18282 [Thalassiosira oceanica]|eukprot:EJK61266.1 hypothetical protein THAOC_18282 [Thalassiosira oceanica]
MAPTFSLVTLPRTSVRLGPAPPNETACEALASVPQRGPNPPAGEGPQDRRRLKKEDVKAARTSRILLNSGDDMSLAEEHQPPAAGPIPDAVTEEELMSSGHKLPEGHTCPLCCLPIALPAGEHSKLKHVCVLQNAHSGQASDAARLALVRKRVDTRDPVATEFLASTYYHGNDGLRQDISRAIVLWSEAALLGDLNAHFNLGRMYFCGEGVEKDEARGIRHWQHAAIQGHPESRCLLGHFEDKSGNHELAVQHLLISAKMGLQKSLNEIKGMFMKGHATKAQYAEALNGYQDALEETKSPQREEAKKFNGSD